MSPRPEPPSRDECELPECAVSDTIVQVKNVQKDTRVNFLARLLIPTLKHIDKKQIVRVKISMSIVLEMD